MLCHLQALVATRFSFLFPPPQTTVLSLTLPDGRLISFRANNDCTLIASHAGLELKAAEAAEGEKYTSR